MNKITSPPEVGINFLSLSHYIASFSTFFIQNGLILLNEENQTVLVLNSFFQNLELSNNESEVKIELLSEIINVPGVSRRNDILGMKHVNETYVKTLNS